MEPKEPSSTVCPKDKEALIVAFRKHTLLPLDDCQYALQESIPWLLFKQNHLRRVRRFLRFKDAAFHKQIPVHHATVILMSDDHDYAKKTVIPKFSPFPYIQRG